MTSALATIPPMRALAGRTPTLRSFVLAVLLLASTTAGLVVVPTSPVAAADDACKDVKGDPEDERALKEAAGERRAIQDELSEILATGRVLEAELEATAEQQQDLEQRLRLYNDEAGAANAELATRARRSYMLTNSDPVLAMLGATDASDVVETSRVLGLLARGSRAELEAASSAVERTNAAADAAAEVAAHLEEIEGRYGEVEAEKKRVLDKAKQAESKLSAKVATQRASNAPAGCPLPGGQVAGGLACPVDQPRSYTDTWGAPRSGGRSHMGVDILAPIGTPLRAYESGTVTRMNHSSLGGISLYMTGASGNQYYYTHLSGYVSGISPGGKVSPGQHIGYVGDTGNAAGIPHLHWEVRPGGGANVNPYPFARQACG